MASNSGARNVTRVLVEAILKCAIPVRPLAQPYDENNYGGLSGNYKSTVHSWTISPVVHGDSSGNPDPRK